VLPVGCAIGVLTAGGVAVQEMESRGKMGYPTVYGLRLSNDIWEEMKNPDWNLIRLCNDWKRYVPTELREKWNSLGTIEMFFVAYMAEQQACSEQWD
jgi:hypothetical protein